MSAAITQELANLVKSELGAKDFSTGSKGFYGSGKITVDGARYQANAQAVLVGSKQDPKAKVKATTAEAVAALTGLIEQGVPARTFKTGKIGYRTQGKVEAHGQKFQVSAQAVKLS
jgi:hypothetical protein